MNWYVSDKFESFKVVPVLQKLHDDLYQIYNRDNWLWNCCYVVVKNNKAVIIDPSFFGTFLVNFLQEKKLEVAGVILTHGHWDHWALSKNFIEFANLKVLCHMNDQVVVENGITRIKEFLNDFNPNNAINEHVNYQDWTQETILKIDDFTFEILPTPGHSPGSVCIKYNNYVFSGDTVFKNSYGRIDLNFSQPEKMKTSLLKFLETYKENYLVYPGHLGNTNMNEVRVFLPQLIESHLE